MDLEHGTVLHFAQTWGLIYFIILMAGVLIYTFWPGNKGKFERAARIPLDDEMPKGRRE